jgi:hypothetical protein
MSGGAAVGGRAGPVRLDFRLEHRRSCDPVGSVGNSDDPMYSTLALIMILQDTDRSTVFYRDVISVPLKCQPARWHSGRPTAEASA